MLSSKHFEQTLGTYRGSVLDMSPQGSCRKVLIENSENMYYRVPSNVASFRQISKITVPQATVWIKYI